MFTGGIDVGTGIQVLKKSVKHPRWLPHTCARVGRTSEGSQRPTLRTSKVSSRVNEDRFFGAMIHTVTKDVVVKTTAMMGRKSVDGGTLCLYTGVVKQFNE